AGEQLVLADRLHPVDADLVVLDVRIVSEHDHVETAREPAQLAADAAEADDAERGARDVAHPAELGVLRPAPRPDLAIRAADAPLTREQEPERVLGHLRRAEVGNVGDDDAAPAGARDVDVVEAHAAARDHLAALEALDERA